MDHPHTTTVPPQSDEKAKAQKKLLINILSYLSVLVIVSYILGKDDPSTHFHIKQGAALLAAEVGTMAIIALIPLLFPLYAVAQIAFLILAIIGIVNAARGKEKELPLIGKFAHHVPL